MEKDGLRSSFKRKLSDLALSEKEIQSEMIVSKLLSYLQNKEGLWALYSPLNDEPDLLAIYDSCPSIQWAFPKVVSKTEMHFYRISSRDQLVASSWGLNEPMGHPDRVVHKDDLQGCIVPGLAFDKKGNRLGRGGGYYDRYLENFKGLRLGVTFKQGLTTETLPRKSHDQQMNYVISPDQWIEVDTSEVSNGI